jgi:hypothetical protein
MTTITQSVQKPIINQLNENADAGFTKSVDALYNDIITLLKHRTEAGLRVCQYNKRWSEFGTMMSPVHIGYYGVTQNSMMLPESELNRLFNTVDEKLTAEKLIIHEWKYKYITPNNVDYTLSIHFNLEVPPIETIEESTHNSPSHSPDKHEYDFKCGSC